MFHSDGRSTFRNVDRIYRRGLVLGLSIAELFLLLLFLLLLALAAASNFWREEQDKAGREKAALAAELRDTRSNAAALLKIQEQLASTGLDRNEIETLIAATRDRQNLKKRVAALETQIDELRPLALIGKEISNVAESSGIDISNILKDPDALQKALERAGDNAAVERQISELREKVAQRGRLIEKLSNSKGIDPSCWYEEVVDGKGKSREIPVFLFDIAVFDQHILVRDRDVSGKFLVEKHTLPTAGIRFMRPLSNREFRRLMWPIRKMGKEDRAIRDYSCVFYVLVWDKTSSGAKERWKSATEGVIGQSFYRKTMYNTPWESRG